MKGLTRPPTDDGQREYKDVSGRPAIPTGGPGVPPLVAASGVGYGEGFAGGTHNVAPTGMIATPLNAAARGDVEMILYLVAKRADAKGHQPRGEDDGGHDERAGAADSAVAGGASAAGEALGAVNNHRCVSC